MTNSTLTSVNLGWNHIGDEGAIKISESLMTNTTLTQLYLNGTINGDNCVGEAGKKALENALKSRSSSLDLLW